MLLRNTRARHAASDRSGQARQQRGGDTMTTHTYASIASIATLAAFTVIGPVCAGGDKVAFPENHEAGVLFTTVDRPDNKQFLRSTPARQPSRRLRTASRCRTAP